MFQWHNPAFDALIGEAAQLGVVQQRLALYHKAEVQVVAQEAVVVPLYYLQAQGWLRPPFRFGVGGWYGRGRLSLSRCAMRGRW
ncbi:MAG: hypothetical protein IPL28_21565 [Chloroflexi bacterium]|nr:hypothetical protein [Chloroflexota bacterium]